MDKPHGQTKKLLRALAGEAFERPPWWLMRQAGRYLPEYRALARAGRRFCRVLSDPRSGGRGDPAAGAPLRHGCGDPVRRHPAGAAGARTAARISARTARCSTGSTRAAGIGRLQPCRDRRSLEPVYETVRRVRGGAAGRDGADRVCRRAVDGRDLYGRGRRAAAISADARAGPIAIPRGFAALIDLIAEATIAYLSRADRGRAPRRCSCSTAGPACLPEREFARWVIAPTRRIAAALKQRFPDRAGHRLSARRRAALRALCGGKRRRCGRRSIRRCRSVSRATSCSRVSPCRAISIRSRCWSAARRWSRRWPKSARALGGGPFVFNLGHGILPQTPPEHVAALAAAARRAGCRIRQGAG